MDWKLKVLVVVAAPFVTLILLRALWFLAGAPWSDPAFAALMSITAVVPAGVLVADL